MSTATAQSPSRRVLGLRRFAAVFVGVGLLTALGMVIAAIRGPAGANALWLATLVDVALCVGVVLFVLVAVLSPPAASRAAIFRRIAMTTLAYLAPLSVLLALDPDPFALHWSSVVGFAVQSISLAVVAGSGILLVVGLQRYEFRAAAIVLLVYLAIMVAPLSLTFFLLHAGEPVGVSTVG